MNKDVVISFDPGRSTGYAVVRLREKGQIPEVLDLGFVKWKSDFKSIQKYMKTIRNLYKTYVPVCCSIELQAGRNANSLIVIAKAAQLIELALMECYAETLIYIMPASQWKKYLVNNGNASKEVVKARLQVLYPKLKITTIDMSDALAMALTLSAIYEERCEIIA